MRDKPQEIVMPQLGLSMDSGLIVRWLKQTGDIVQQGEIILEVESDKSIVEVEAVASGHLQIVLGPDAGEVKVGKVIGYLLAEGQVPVRADLVPTHRVSAGDEHPHLASAQSTVPEVVTVAPTATSSMHAWLATSDGGKRPPSTPAARRLAEELGIDWRLATPTGLRGQIREYDVIALSATQKFNPKPTQPYPLAEINITPVARRLAEATGLDLATLADAFPNQRIGRTEVEQALRQTIAGVHKGFQLPATQTPVGDPTLSAWPLDEIHRSLPARREPTSLLRRAVAERMSASAHIGAAVTLTTKADASELVRLRNSMKTSGSIQPVPSYNVLLASLTARALGEHPLLNASLNVEEIIYWETVNMGIAVDTPRGLVVPVLRDAATKTLAQLTREADDLLARAAAGKAQPDELSGGTFTITNLGTEDIQFFTPIINPPQCAVLGVGQLKKEWGVADDNQPTVRTMLPLSLSFDHRLVDGAPAARFLKRVKQFVEEPYLWLR